MPFPVVGAPLGHSNPLAPFTGASHSPAIQDRIVDDEDGSSWAFLQQATLAVVVAAAVATTGRAAQAQQLANAWQDELPASGYGWTSPTQLDLWTQSTGKPRFLLLTGAGDELVPQPTPPALDDSGESPAVTARPRLALDVWAIEDDLPRVGLDEFYELQLQPPATRPIARLEAIDELIVPQPAPTISVDEVYWLQPDPAPRALAFPAAPDTDQIVAQPAALGVDDSDGGTPWLFIAAANVWMPVPWQFGGESGSVWSPIAEDYELAPLPPRRPLVALWDAPADDVIVPQPTPLHVDEDYWLAPPSFITAARGVLVAIDNPEIVPQAAALRLEEGTWEPPFVVPAVRALAVEQRQDEVVPTIRVDELAPDPWLLIPAKRIIAFPLPPDDWPILTGAVPEIAGARVEVFPVFAIDVEIGPARTASVEVEPVFTARVDISPEPQP